MIEIIMIEIKIVVYSKQTISFAKIRGYQGRSAENITIIHRRVIQHQISQFQPIHNNLEFHRRQHEEF